MQPGPARCAMEVAAACARHEAASCDSWTCLWLSAPPSHWKGRMPRAPHTSMQEPAPSRCRCQSRAYRLSSTPPSTLLHQIPRPVDLQLCWVQQHRLWMRTCCLPPQTSADSGHVATLERPRSVGRLSSLAEWSGCRTSRRLVGFEGLRRDESEILYPAPRGQLTTGRPAHSFATSVAPRAAGHSSQAAPVTTRPASHGRRLSRPSGLVCVVHSS